MSTTLPPWPPSLTPAQKAELLLLSSSWALSHGFTLLPPDFPPHAPTHAIAAPLSLFPTPFPRDLYDLVKEIQPIYNGLYARIAEDWDFLDRVMGGSVSLVDEFQGELWRGWKKIRDELVQPIQLGLFRSDYLLHSTSPDTPTEVKQVEFNTISVSFGSLSQRAGEMHRYLSATTGGYYSVSPHLSDPSNLPQNESLEELAAGLAIGWKAYGRKNAIVLFVVQQGERNVFDQRWLQYRLLETHGIRTVRHTFAELSTLPRIDPKTKVLTLPQHANPSAPPQEVAVIYYRSAYTPSDYPSSTEWETRLKLETTLAIKCPSMALQLAGAKKIQQVLAEPGVLEDFLSNPSRPDVAFGRDVSKEDIEKIRSTWTGLWPMDDSPMGKEAYQLALSQPERFVLKPQREGGGNNIYRTDIPPYLAGLEKEELKPGEPARKEGYILMELIQPPAGVHNWLVRGGEGVPRLADVVSEIGVYGIMLFGGKEVVNKEAGTLLRTKGRESDEGGVAIGISSIDSPLLV